MTDLPAPLRLLKGQAWEALSLARLAAHFPLGLLPTSVAELRADPAHRPVVLVHGYAHNHSGWYVLEKALRKEGYSHLSAIDHDPWVRAVPEIARQLAAHVREVKAKTGSPKVHVVGHSLGGLILRWYVQELGGDEHVDTAVTICSPHRGSPIARLGGLRTMQDLAPGSTLLRQLAHGTRETDVRWVGVWSDTDALVPGWSARLDHPHLKATNHKARFHGHLSAIVSPVVVRNVVHELVASDARPVGPARVLPLRPAA